MTNAVRGTLSVDFEGRPLRLSLTTNSMCELEALDGRPILEIVGELENFQSARMATMRKMFWAFMLDDRPDATIQDASALMDALRGRTHDVIVSAISAAFPDPAPDDRDGGAPAPEK